MRVPSWTNNGIYSNFSAVTAHAQGLALSNRNISISSATFETYGSGVFPGTSAYTGGTVAPNGKIYFAPYTATTGIVFNPVNNSIGTFGPIQSNGTGKNQGGILAPNGKIYIIPDNNTVVTVLDPSSDTVSSIVGPGGADKCAGGAIGSSGKIYCFPTNVNNFIFVINPANNTISSISLPSTGGYGRPITLKDGRVFSNPIPGYDITLFRVVDPTNDSVSSYGISDTSLIAGSFLAEQALNGKIFLVPNNGNVIGVVDPDNNFAISTYATGGLNGCQHPTKLANGKLFTSSGSQTSIAWIDPDDVSITTLRVASVGGSTPYGFHINHPNGKVYFIPLNASSGLAMNPGFNNNFNINLCTSPLLNNA
jgi:streptogramin lyase